MNRLSVEKRAQILGMMVEGVFIRAIARMTNASKNTIVKLLVGAGNACLDYQDRCAISPASAFKPMKSGASYMRSNGMFPKRSAANLDMATCGRGRRSMPTGS